MKNTFLFDLDGTLLPMDFDKFMKLYFYNLGVHFHGKIDPELLAKYILLATEKIATTKNNESNETVFMNHFEELIGEDITEYRKMFDEYYDTLFDNVKDSTYKSIEMRKSVDLLKEKGYQVVIATNPLFPLKANHYRLNWAGFEPNEFLHITSFEESTSCKPHLEYYQEVLKKINKSPEECIMVGNDIFDDLPASNLGIETYLITDCLVNKYELPNTADYTGDYKSFYEFVKKLDYINKW